MIKENLLDDDILSQFIPIIKEFLQSTTNKDGEKRIYIYLNIPLITLILMNYYIYLNIIRICRFMDINFK